MMFQYLKRPVGSFAKQAPTGSAPPRRSVCALGKCLTIESQTNFEMGEPRISISYVSKKEGKRNQPTLFTFTVSLSTAYDQPVTVSFRTVNGTARTSDSD